MLDWISNKPENLIFFLLFIVPGFLSLKVYDHFIPTQKREIQNSLIEIITYSLFNAAVVWWPVSLLFKNNIPVDHPFWFEGFCILFLAVLPALWAYFYVLFRKYGPIKHLMLSPYPQAWDFYFACNTESWVLFHLKNGKMLGGYFGAKSFASAFPEDPTIYVEKTCSVDLNGRFVKEIESTNGLLVRFEDCERLEFLKVEAENG